MHPRQPPLPPLPKPPTPRAAGLPPGATAPSLRPAPSPEPARPGMVASGPTGSEPAGKTGMAASAPSPATGPLSTGIPAMPSLASPAGAERRATPRRRLRDRVASRDGTANPALNGRYELQNLLLLIDDDLRETALALGSIERFIGRAIELLERSDVSGEELRALAGDDAVGDKLDVFVESLLSLRRRIGQVASTLAK